jgi:hypothetical protein
VIRELGSIGMSGNPLIFCDLLTDGVDIGDQVTKSNLNILS